MQSVITNKIDWENRVIYGASGRQYLIDPESISSARYIEFEIRSMTQAFKINLDGIMSTLTSIESHLTTGKLNTAGNIHNALNELQSFKTGLLDHEKFKRTESIEFCALFAHILEKIWRYSPKRK